MKTDRDRPPVVLFLVLFFGMVAVAIGLAALDAPPQSGAGAAAKQNLQPVGQEPGKAPSEAAADPFRR